MKRVKKFAAVLLTMIMALLMGMSALAAGNGKITVDNPLEGQTYTAYKIFDVKYDNDLKAYAYTIDGGSEWYSVVTNYAGVTLTKIQDTNVYVVEKNNTFSAAAFANHLKANAAGKTGTQLNKTGNVAEATNLDLGYYFVNSTSGALCNLTTTDPTTTIHDKNDMPFEKTDDKTDVQIGEVVNYTLTGKVPDTTGFTDYTYEITDTMSAGLTFKKDVVVKVAGTVLAADKYELTQNPDGFVLKIHVIDMQEQVGKEIKVTYTAVVNDQAVSVVSNNHAVLKYSNDPTTSTTMKIEREENVFSTKLIIDKYKKDETATKLEGAKFVLKNEAGKYYKYTAAAGTESAKVEWVDNQNDATVVTTDTNGAATINGLKNGKYSLKEIEAPIGYNMLTSEVEVTIDGNNKDAGTLTVTKPVENSTGTILPETGGMGTTLFYALGGVLAVGAGILLIVKRRMNAAE